MSQMFFLILYLVYLIFFILGGCYGGALVFLGRAEAPASPSLAPPMLLVVYGCFFFCLNIFKWVGGQTESKSITLFTADAETILVWMRFFAGIFHISFSPLTSLSILMLNFTELMASDDYLNLILQSACL